MPTQGGWLCTIASTKHEANRSKNTGEENHFSFVEKDSTTKGAIQSSGGSCCIHLQRFSWHYHRPPEKCIIPSAELSAWVPRVLTPVPTKGSIRDSDMCCLLPVPLLAVLLPKGNSSALPPYHPDESCLLLRFLHTFSLQTGAGFSMRPRSFGTRLVGLICAVARAGVNSFSSPYSISREWPATDFSSYC